MRSCVLTAPLGASVHAFLFSIISGWTILPGCTSSQHSPAGLKEVSADSEQIPNEADVEARKRLRSGTSTGGAVVSSSGATTAGGQGPSSITVTPATFVVPASGGQPGTAPQSTGNGRESTSSGGQAPRGVTTLDTTVVANGGNAISVGSQIQNSAGGQTRASTLAVQDTIQTPRPGRRFRENLGLSTKFAQGQPNSDLSMVTELGVKWARDSVDWNLMEPTAGHYIEFPAAFRERIEFYKAHDIGIIYMLAYDAYDAYKPTESNPGAAFDPVAFGNYAVEAAKQLRAAGVRFVLEMWNEPHNMVIRRDLGGAWNGCPPSPWVDHYVKMVKEAVGRVKAYDPSIRLVTNDDMWILHYQFLEAGLPQQTDGFAFHPYVQGIPERAAIDQTTDWMSPFVGVDADSSFASAVRRLREHGNTKFGREPEMWITEWGWPVNQATENGTTFSEDTVAAWLPRAFVLAEAAGVENMCWFSTQDNGDGPMGLTTNAGQKRKSYLTFKALSDTLGDFFYLRQVTGGDHRTTGAQAFQFWRDTASKLVVWSVEPALEWLKLDDQLAAAKVTDAYGQPVPIARNSSGTGFVPLGAAPIYLDFALQQTPPVLEVAARTDSTPPN